MFGQNQQEEHLKCNVDTAYYDEQNLYCVGACIRDDKGNFIEAIMRNYSAKPLIAEAEAHGVLEVLRWIGEHNSITDQIVVEMDCLQVAQAINSRQNNDTELGAIIDKCRNLLALNKHCSISYVRQQTNRVAHELAQTFRFHASPQVLNHCPLSIEHILMNEIH